MIELKLNESNGEKTDPPKEIIINIIVNDNDADPNTLRVEFGRHLSALVCTPQQARSLSDLLLARAAVEQRQQKDWDDCLERFRAIRAEYMNLVNTPGSNPHFALQHVFRPLMMRFYQGERSPELYRAMMSIK